MKRTENSLEVLIITVLLAFGSQCILGQIIVPIENYTSSIDQHEIQLVLLTDGSKLGIHIKKPDGLEILMKEITSSGEVKNLTGNFLSSPSELYETLKGGFEKSANTPSTLVLDLITPALIYMSTPFNKDFTMIIKLNKVTYDLEAKINYILNKIHETSFEQISPLWIANSNTNINVSSNRKTVIKINRNTVWECILAEPTYSIK